MLLRQLYNWALSILTLPAALYLRFHAIHRPLLERFSPRVPQLDARPIWVQAASLGEVNTAQPLLRAMGAHWPDLPILLTTSTVTGKAQAEALWAASEALDVNVEIAWFPFDHRRSVCGFLERANPRCLILVETELWPNVLYYAHRLDIPVFIVNGRISAKHNERYERAQRFFAPLLNPITLACMQTATDADRIGQLGVQQERMVLTGNIKFDGAKTEIDEDRRRELRVALGLDPGQQVIVFGSTRPGDEAIALTCWTLLADRFPDSFLVIAPRHSKRIQEAMEPFENEDVLLRSRMSAGEQTVGNERVLFVDTMGELGLFYSLATVAVVGGSFSEQVQGHNPIEPAAMGIPTVFGPHMKNFQAPADILVEARGAVQVDESGALASVLLDLLNSEQRLEELGTNGRAAVLSNRGAIAKTIEHITPFIDLV